MGMPDPVTLVRELNHRVKNNLQIIVSLMNLQKRMMPPDRREDIRFIEEHVQSMSVAYRLVYATGSMVEISLSELVTEVVSGLRQISGLPEDQIQLDDDFADTLIGLDFAIALSLYLAVILPPYLDRALAISGSVTVAVSMFADFLTLSIRGSWHGPVALDSLRARLMRAYAGQIQAEILPAAIHGADQIRFTPEKPARAPTI